MHYRDVPTKVRRPLNLTKWTVQRSFAQTMTIKIFDFCCLPKQIIVSFVCEGDTVSCGHEAGDGRVLVYLFQAVELPKLLDKQLELGIALDIHTITKLKLEFWLILRLQTRVSDPHFFFRIRIHFFTIQMILNSLKIFFKRIYENCFGSKLPETDY